MTPEETLRAADEWLSRFEYTLILDKGKVTKDELKSWCHDIIGKEYKDWYLFSGGTGCAVAFLHIVDSRMSSLAVLRWGDCLAK